MLSRRDRVRAATAVEIKQTARRIVLERGPQAASLRAVAREVGMTAPGLYRYFASRQELLNHVAADILADLADDINTAVNQAGAPGDTDPADRLAVACSEFRRWSLGHRTVFGMLFCAPVPGWNVEQDQVTAESGQKFASAFLGPFLQLWRTSPFPAPEDDEIDPGLRQQLERYRSQAKADLPLGAVLVFLQCWERLYGLVATEVSGCQGFALDNAGPMFQLICGRDLAVGRPWLLQPATGAAPITRQSRPNHAWPSDQRPDRPGRAGSIFGGAAAAHSEPPGVIPARTRMAASQRRETVLQAALIEFAAHGLDGTSTKNIAQRAGISQPYLFRLFPTKKTLFLALIRRCSQQVTEVLATAAAGRAGKEALQAMGSAFRQLCKERTLPLIQLHAYAACADPEIRAATRAAFWELRISVEKLTGLPPAQVQRWFGIGMLMTATTAMNLQADNIPRHAAAGERRTVRGEMSSPVSCRIFDHV